MLFAVTAEPLCVSDVFHACVTVCPALNDHVNVHAVSGSPRLVTDTLAPNPPCHCDDTA
ncbi:hypothetical protein GCM10028775_77770 [Catellatospora paridis]